MVMAGRVGIQVARQLRRGDKTLLDALAPASDALVRAAEAGVDLATALGEAAAAAAAGAADTTAMRARVGRAGWLADRSEGHEDAGVHSVALVFASAARHVSAP